MADNQLSVHDRPIRTLLGRRFAAALACLALVATAACGSRIDTSTTDQVTTPAPVPPTSETPTPKGTLEQMTLAVREEAERMIGGPHAELEVTCPDIRGDKTCDAVFRGHRVRFDLEIKGATSTRVTYDITTEQRFLTKENLHRSFYKSVVDNANGKAPDPDEQLRCDMVPDVSVKTIGKEKLASLGLRCFHYDGTFTKERHVKSSGAHLVFSSEP
ncbi:hypothetical protein [Kibdelosporangium phytohabitans]|nr:hypothetical protein [Kibdelosporangium phytohabitans]MBE1468596.1 hypothetical protein [Kibdelosporangium phytohabitans]